MSKSGKDVKLISESSYNGGRLNYVAVDSWRSDNGYRTSFVPSDKTRGRGYGVDVGNYFINKLKSGDEDQLVIMYAGAADTMFAPLEQATMLLDTNDIAGSVAKIVKMLREDYASFETYVPALIERVKELNPDCTIALVGTFNPVKNLSVSDKVYLPIFNAMASITEKMNKSYQRWAKATDKCVYIDIANAETATLEKGITAERLIASLTGSAEDGFYAEDIYHATPEGYRYIARQITDQFAVDKERPFAKIVVDMGSLDAVKSVKLDGIYVSFDFNSENQKLTAPCWHVAAKTMTVTGEKNGQTIVCVYKLDGNIFRGYTARQTYATNDAKAFFAAKVLKTVTLLNTAIVVLK